MEPQQVHEVEDVAPGHPLKGRQAISPGQRPGLKQPIALHHGPPVQRQEFPRPICFVLALALASCTSTRHAIVAATGTNIGVDISQNPATNSPQAKLGYQRLELAIVPTNRSAGEAAGNTGGGASEYGDVLMELRYGGIFDTGPSSGIYQRLAVGSEAVRQPGASLMFARDADGNVSNDAEAALRSLMSVPAMPKDMRDAVTHIRRLRACHREEVDAAITASGAGSYDDLADHKVTVAQLEQIMEAVRSLPPCP